MSSVSTKEKYDMFNLIALLAKHAYKKGGKMSQNKTESMTIKWRLAAVMADRELDYRQLAEKTGLHPVTISKLKNTYFMPRRLDSETLEKLCKALGCQPADLMRYQADEEIAS